MHLGRGLLAATADRERGRIFSGEQARSDGGRRSGAQPRDLHRVDHRERRPGSGIGEDDDALNARHAERVVAGEVPVDLGREVVAAEAQDTGLDVKASGRIGDAEHARSGGGTAAEQPERPLDCVEAGIHTEQRPDVGAREEECHATSISSM